MSAGIQFPNISDVAAVSPVQREIQLIIFKTEMSIVSHEACSKQIEFLKFQIVQAKAPKAARKAFLWG